ncbi:hypothetical protein [Nostoc sp. 'Peltigera membranacea cyanobiont' 213]|nr:hypothetical protein [Nostoc sp. 'Peltigera membranacea cyanobiont' 213]
MLPIAKRTNYGFLATFGDPGWGKAEGRRQKEEEGKIPIIEALLGL